MFHIAMVYLQKKGQGLLTNNPLREDDNELKLFTLYFLTLPEESKPMILLNGLAYK